MSASVVEMTRADPVAVATTGPGRARGSLTASPGGLEDEASLGVLLDASLSAMEALALRLEPERIAARDALSAFARLDRLVRLADGAKTRLARRVATTSLATDAGYRDAAEQLAAIEGTSKGRARGRLERASTLEAAPKLAEAVSGGELSPEQTDAIADALTTAPEAEAELLKTAFEEPLSVLKDACREAKATGAKADPVATRRAIHAKRFFRHYLDAEGAFCFSGRDLPERGARLVALLEATVAKEAEATKEAPGEPHEPFPARLADAFFALCAHVEEGEEKEGRKGGPRATLVVRVDLEALQRRRLFGGETSTIEGLGPIPLKGVETLLSDAFVAYVFHRAGDIAAVYHHGRTINATLRTALLERDRCCVVPGCGVRHGLEIDHVVPYCEGGPTTLSNLARLCHHHHFLKTFEDWRLERIDPPRGGPPTWRFIPPEVLVPFGEEPENLALRPPHLLASPPTGPPR